MYDKHRDKSWFAFLIMAVERRRSLPIRLPRNVSSPGTSDTIISKNIGDDDDMEKSNDAGQDDDDTSSVRVRSIRCLRRSNTTGHETDLRDSGMSSISSMAGSLSFQSSLMSDHHNRLYRSPTMRSMSKTLQSTENLHRWNVTVHGTPPKFYGAYGHIRAILDHTYHAYYRKERQWLHDSIIEEIIDRSIHPDFGVITGSGDDDSETNAAVSGDNSSTTALSTSPTSKLKADSDQPDSLWLILSAGVYGAGKRHAIATISSFNMLPLFATVFVDVDEIRRMLPEFSMLFSECPALVDTMTKKECGYIAETIVHAALQAGRNVILDSSLQDTDWYIHYIQTLRQMYSPHSTTTTSTAKNQEQNDMDCQQITPENAAARQLRVALLHVTASIDNILERIRRHTYFIERLIPADPSLITEIIHSVAESVQRVQAVVDFSARITNDQAVGLPEIDIFSPATISQEEKWQRFQATFVQRSLRTTGSSNSKNLDCLKSTQQSATISTSSTAMRSSSILQRNRQRSMHRSRRFSVLVSSEDNHRANHNRYYGQFAHIRASLDYTYHANYTFERQIFQDTIIREFVDSAIITDQNGEICTTPTEPWIGKSERFLTAMYSRHLFRFFIID
jgi:hypothetical protein